MKLLLTLLCTLPLLTIAQQDYWQQEVNYSINVELNDSAHTLTGEEELIYHNNSPASLDTIVFHLWPNAYKSQETALAKQLFRINNSSYHLLENKQDQGYIDSLDFKVNEKTVKWFYDKQHKDICYLVLNETLKSGESIHITTPFFVKIPNAAISRLGHVGESYQITQWYPKPAVYDKNGWNQMPYINYGEFYSEFGTFDINITLPYNYRVSATGDLVGPYAKKELAFRDSIYQITKQLKEFDTGDLEFPKSSKQKKTLHFYQKNVHDFAWFADKRYHILKGEVELPHSKRKVTSWAMFTNNEAPLWLKSIDYINQSTYDYSLWNGDYPYDHVSAVDGTIAAGGGMEYPNVTVIGESHSPVMLELVIAHEVGHNWFYGILGSNERNFAWMDEGINSFNEKRYIEKHHPKYHLLKSYFPHLGNHVVGKEIPSYGDGYFIQSLFMMRAGQDQAIQLHSDDFTEINYGMMVYAKSAASLQYLSDYLGQEVFDECMQSYFNKWKFKHPQPEDIKRLFEEVSGKDLTWFFIDLIQTNHHIDYKIKSYEKQDSTIQVKVANHGQIAAPLSITLYNKGLAIHKAWFKGFDQEQLLQVPEMDFDKIVINANLETIEMYRHNNRMKAKGMFKKLEPLQFSFVGDLEKNKHKQVYWSPILGWNQLDGLIIGGAFYNTSVLHKKLNWHIMPLYGTKSHELLGSTSLQYNIFKPFKHSDQISFTSELKRYSLYTNGAEGSETNEIYNRIKNTVKINLFSKAKSLGRHQLAFNHYYFDQKFSNYFVEENQNIFKFTYKFKRQSLFQEQDFKLQYDLINEFNRIHFTYNNKIHYSKKPSLYDKFFYLRIFGGTMMNNEARDSRYQFRLSGLNGGQDIFMDNLFLNRAPNWNNLLANQMVMADGGFATRTVFGYANWMLSANIKTDMPALKKYGILRLKWLRPYMNVAYLPNFNGSENLMVSELGLNINLINKYLQVYIPLKSSEEIDNNYNLIYPNAHPLHRMRFTLQFDAAKLYKLVDQFNEI